MAGRNGGARLRIPGGAVAGVGRVEERGFLVSTNPDSSFIYLLTGAHAVHLAGGIIAMLWASATALRHKAIEAQRIAVDATAWYWHFMLVLWIYVFVLLGFVR